MFVRPSTGVAGLRASTCTLAVATAVFASGCQAPRKSTTVQYEHGLVWVFPGVEGGASSVADAVRAFRDAGVESAIEIHDWQRPFGLISNLVSYERNRADAARIAERLADYATEHPHVPIDLVGYSGGGGMAIMVAEALPPHVRLRNIVLGQPALSVDYDLTPAAAHVDGRIVNFHSDYDWVILGAGTSLMGTMDRKHGPSAGWHGFKADEAVADEALRYKLVQQKWTPEMIRDGHLGGHAYMFSYAWNKRWIAPWLMQPTNGGPIR